MAVTLRSEKRSFWPITYDKERKSGLSIDLLNIVRECSIHDLLGSKQTLAMSSPSYYFCDCLVSQIIAFKFIKNYSSK